MESLFEGDISNQIESGRIKLHQTWVHNLELQNTAQNKAP